MHHPPRVVYLGLEYQRSFASNTLRGVSADATAVIAPLVAWIRDAPLTVGLTTPQIHAPTAASAAKDYWMRRSVS